MTAPVYNMWLSGIGMAFGTREVSPAKTHLMTVQAGKSPADCHSPKVMVEIAFELS